MSVTVTNIMAVSLDGLIGSNSLESDVERRNYNFTNNDDREFVREQLEQADAVITGANSLRASGCAWTVSNDRNVNPAWIVFTTSGIASELEFWRQKHIRRVLVSPFPVQEQLCAASGVENWIVNKKSPNDVLTRLEGEGLGRILLFGGGAINKLFYENGLVDFAKITLCPLVIGGVNSPRFVDLGLKTPIHFTAVSSVLKKDLVFLTYRVKK